MVFTYFIFVLFPQISHPEYIFFLISAELLFCSFTDLEQKNTCLTRERGGAGGIPAALAFLSQMDRASGAGPPGPPGATGRLPSRGPALTLRVTNPRGSQVLP